MLLFIIQNIVILIDGCELLVYIQLQAKHDVLQQA
jgi:hypothetical protein